MDAAEEGKMQVSSRVFISIKDTSIRVWPKVQEKMTGQEKRVLTCARLARRRGIISRPEPKPGENFERGISADTEPLKRW